MYTASTIRPCSRDDPQLERCIIDAVYKIRPLLVHGDLGDGYRTPPLEPLALDDIELGRSSQFQAVFQDLEARGGSNFIIDRLMYVRPNNAKDEVNDMLIPSMKCQTDGHCVRSLDYPPAHRLPGQVLAAPQPAALGHQREGEHAGLLR